jgi:hypothetical protein
MKKHGSTLVSFRWLSRLSTVAVGAWSLQSIFESAPHLVALGVCAFSRTFLLLTDDQTFGARW